MRKLIILVVIITITACNPCKDVGDPPTIGLNFILVDQYGNDLFFDTNSVYDPYDVVFGINQDPDVVSKNWFIIFDSSHFQLDHFYPLIDEPHEFHVQFFLNRIDTILIIDSELSDLTNCWHEYDVYFNSNPVCLDCKKIEIYEIIIEE